MPPKTTPCPRIEARPPATPGVVLLWSVLGIFRLLIVAARLSDHDVIDLLLYLAMVADAWVMALRGEGADLEIAKTFRAPVPQTDCLALVLDVRLVIDNNGSALDASRGISNNINRTIQSINSGNGTWRRHLLGTSLSNSLEGIITSMVLLSDMFTIALDTATA